MLSLSDGAQLVQTAKQLGQMPEETMVQIMRTPFDQAKEDGISWPWDILSQPDYQLTVAQYSQALFNHPNLMSRRLSALWTKEEKEKIYRARLTYFQEIIEGAQQSQDLYTYWSQVLADGGSLILKAALITLNNAFIFDQGTQKLTEEGRAIDGDFDAIEHVLNALENEINKMQQQDILSSYFQGVEANAICKDIISSQIGTFGHAVKSASAIKKLGEKNYKLTLQKTAEAQNANIEAPITPMIPEKLYSEAACLCGHIYGVLRGTQKIDQENRQKRNSYVGAEAAFLTELVLAAGSFKNNTYGNLPEEEIRKNFITHIAPVVYARTIPLVKRFYSFD